ncbi:hypothetical protein ACHAXT_003403 [Thalassiosira profunda]
MGEPTPPPQTPAEAAAFLRSEMQATWQWRVDTDPELAASLGLLSSRRSTHALDPRSVESFRDRLAWVKGALERVEAAIPDGDAERLMESEEDRLSRTLYVQQLRDYVTCTEKHKGYLNCVNRLEGPQTDLPMYARNIPLKTAEQRDFYLQFLRALPTQLEEVTALLKLGLMEGRTPPRVSLGGVVPQIRKMVGGGCSAFLDPLEKAGAGHEEWESECTKIVAAEVTVAFASFADFLESEYIPHLREAISATKGYPDGEAYYKDCLEFHTTTKMTAEEIHQLGLDEVKRIKLEMKAIAAEDGYEGRIGEYMEHLRTSSEFTPASGSTLCAHYRDICGRIAPALLNLFHVKTLPRTPFSIVETPEASASMAPAAYYLAGGGGRPGTFYVNTSELSTRRTYECESLALHEAIPGHHTQAAIQGENEELPDFRRHCEDRRYFEAPSRFPFYTGYVEGWGLHCETLGEEHGLYNTASDRMGQLSMEALRSCRLVVDTGMHAFGWTAERALQYMLDNTAMGEHDARTEVTRYITWPGQATAYKVGERVFHRLRKKAETELGESFDPRDFYDVVLQCGPVPLSVLEELVDEYISSTDDSAKRQTSSEFVESMTFANWCKCCIVPGACQV